MLCRLQIRNFALIEQVELELGPGLNVLTGETGAGKSIIIDAVEVVLGGRSSADSVRTGCETATVQALFVGVDHPDLLAALTRMGLPTGEELLFTREIHANGRSQCRVNGSLVTAAMVRELSSHLVDIHGQHEQQSLLQRNVQRALLDEFGGAELIAVREEFADYWRRREQCRSELRQLAGNEQERARQLDLLKFQYEEIEQARLYPQEEEDLLTEARILANAEELANAVAAAYEFVYGGEQAAAGLTGLALQRLVTGVAIDPTLSRLEKDLQGALTQLEEVGRELRTYWETVAVDPERLAAVEQRLETIRRLKRKYGNDVTEILAFAARARQEAERLASSAETAQALQTELSGIEKALADSGCRLRMLRKQAARDLEKLVDRELAELGMGEARFQVVIQGELDPDGIDIGEGPQKGSWHGLDNSEFLLSANPGEPPKQLARVASGGELSRVMLALKTVLTGSGGVSTLIFDEIDAGIGGRTATAVGERLARLAAERQVLCVTHLAQIAACADRQYLISKENLGGRSQTQVRCLDWDERVEELARMLGGDAETGREHARRIMQR